MYLAKTTTTSYLDRTLPRTTERLTQIQQTKSTMQELKYVTTKHDIGKKAEIMAQRRAFITLKDHRENPPKNTNCRLINPAKSNLGRVSKSVLDKISQKLLTATGANQWRNTKAVIGGLRKSTTRTEKHSFIVFEIVDFTHQSLKHFWTTPLITPSSSLPSQTTTDREIIVHTRKSPYCLTTTHHE